MPIAEESGLITDVGRWVAGRVCQQIAAWQYFGISPGRVAINVSGHEFGHGDVVSTLANAVRNAHIAASAVELEITESVLISDIRSVIQSLHALREHGFSLAVDDFGTGYSSTYRLYRRSMNANAKECLDLENELRRALENDELEMYYQPKYCSESLEISGAEALLRWFHPERGEIPPNTFVPIAEESGLITDVGRWVAGRVCQQIAAWQYFGISPGRVAINVSGHEFGHGDVVSTLANAVRNAHIAASAVELEITESVLISDIRSVIQSLHALRAGYLRKSGDIRRRGVAALVSS